MAKHENSFVRKKNINLKRACPLITWFHLFSRAVNGPENFSQSAWSVTDNRTTDNILPSLIILNYHLNLINPSNLIFIGLPLSTVKTWLINHTRRPDWAWTLHTQFKIHKEAFSLSGLLFMTSWELVDLICKWSFRENYYIGTSM